MSTVSVCIITKNEEKNILNLINNIVKMADEIILVDNHSTDKTVKIAMEYGAKVIHYDGDKEYEQRNLYLKNATGDWILVLDADERIDYEKFIFFKRKILDNELNHTLSYYLPIINFYGEGKWARTTIVRLFRNYKEIYYEQAEIHTSVLSSINLVQNVEFRQKIDILDIPIYHLDGIQLSRRYGKREKYKALILECLRKFKDTNMEYKYHNYLGIEYAAEGNYKDAFQEFEFVAEKGGNRNILPLYFMARTKLMDGDIASAEMFIDAYLKRCNVDELPFNEAILKERKARGILTKIDIFCKTGKYREAFELLNSLDETAASLINKYFILKQMNIIDPTLFAKAVKLNPYMKFEHIYRKNVRPNIYEFQSDFICECKDIRYEILKNKICILS